MMARGELVHLVDSSVLGEAAGLAGIEFSAASKLVRALASMPKEKTDRLTQWIDEERVRLANVAARKRAER